jgi:hypothetical protein
MSPPETREAPRILGSQQPYDCWKPGIRGLIGRSGAKGPQRTPHRIRGYFCSERSAASTTLVINSATVMGPTPPGFGDSHPATSATAGSTSP